jgi:hypothetical protein
MILDMIQGCRYLRRSTDRWTLSKNSTTQLKDSKVWRKAGLLWECSITITYIQASYLYPVLARLLVDHEHNIWYLILTPKCECLSIHSSLPPRPRHHTIPRNQCKQSFCRTEANCRPQASLPNLLKKSSSARRDFFTKLGPQIRLSPVPIFGVNICPFNYGIKVILFQNWLQLPTSSSQICSTPILPPCNPSESPSRSKP